MFKTNLNLEQSLFQREFPLGYTIFQSFRAIFLSTTGFVITLPYCYCNSEVRRALTTRYRETAESQGRMRKIIFQMATLDHGAKCWL